MLESTQKFGVVNLCEPAPAHSKKLGENILAAMRGQEDKMRIQAAAVLMPQHGIILTGVDFDKTIDALERIDGNAYCLTVRKQLGSAGEDFAGNFDPGSACLFRRVEHDPDLALKMIPENRGVLNLP